MSYEIISADTHLDITWLPGDMFVEGAPADMKSRMPRIKDTDAGPRWMVEDTDVAGVGGGGLTGNFSKYVRGQSKLLDKMDDVGFFSGIDEGIYHPSSVELRVKDQDIDGIDAEVMYGILAIGGGAFSIPGFQDPAVLATVYDVYNAWVGDFVKANPQRLGALGCLSVHDPQDAARQLRLAAESGLRGAEINVKKMTKPMYHGAWNPLWEASQELGMPVSFHALGLELRGPDPEDEAEYGTRTPGNEHGDVPAVGCGDSVGRSAVRGVRAVPGIQVRTWRVRNWVDTLRGRKDGYGIRGQILPPGSEP